ncbi:MAG: class I SAM-dependent methyltransferase [Planctomycetaceae bacterium]
MIDMIETVLGESSIEADQPSPPRDGLPKYAALLAARHAAHGPELFQFLKRLWGGQELEALDVACGDGFYTAAFDTLLGEKSRVTAVDVSPAFLDWAARRVATAGRNSRVGFVRADAGCLPFPDGSFDLVWCAQSLISLPDAAAALREMRRVVRPGGLIGLLENDRLHEMQLPWPVDLELAVRTAERRKETGGAQPEKRNAGRCLSELAGSSGLMPFRRMTLTVDRLAPLSPADARFVELYLKTLVERLAGLLEPAVDRDLRRLTLASSPGYLPASKSFWMTWSDMILLATPE